MARTNRNLNVVISVRVTEKEKIVIKGLATRNEMSIARLVRELIFGSGLVGSK